MYTLLDKDDYDKLIACFKGNKITFDKEIQHESTGEYVTYGMEFSYNDRTNRVEIYFLAIDKAGVADRKDLWWDYRYFANDVFVYWEHIPEDHRVVLSFYLDKLKNTFESKLGV